MLIDGIGISGYRSFGELQLIGPFSKANVFIGQNNVGKSNILLFLCQHFARVVESARAGKGSAESSADDQHMGEESDRTRLAFGLTIDGEQYKALLEQHRPLRADPERASLDQLLRAKPLSRGTALAWFAYEGIVAPRPPLKLADDYFQELTRAPVLTGPQWSQLLDAFGGSGAGLDSVVPWIVRSASPVHFDPPRVAMIPALRRVRDPELLSVEEYGNKGIIDLLVRLQNPTYQEKALERRFEQINEFLASVTGEKDASLKIPHTKDAIEVDMGGKRLPLESVGSGIHEVVILAAYATVLENQVICIEEPELHLHPLLQKKLFHYLLERTSNQYFISSHSAHLMDHPDISVFHVRLEDGHSIVTAARTPDDKSLICGDLGYRGSDIMQANCVIWVEGPSDRIYLRHWIRAAVPELREGVEYSVMFYGGRLLSHLTPLDPDDDDVVDFISLCRLNRHVAIVIDSDRRAAADTINGTKRRICDEIARGPGLAWVTKGREIENYVAPEILEKAIIKEYPNAPLPIPTGKYEDCLPSRSPGAKSKVDKIKVARAVAELPAKTTRLDLSDRIHDLVRFIREANGLEPSEESPTSSVSDSGDV